MFFDILNDAGMGIPMLRIYGFDHSDVKNIDEIISGIVSGEKVSGDIVSSEQTILCAKVGVPLLAQVGESKIIWQEPASNWSNILEMISFFSEISPDRSKFQWLSEHRDGEDKFLVLFSESIDGEW